MQPWEYFADQMERRCGTGERGSRGLGAAAEAGELLVLRLTTVEGWPWLPARILAAQLEDRVVSATVRREPWEELRPGLRALWEAVRPQDPSLAPWGGLVGFHPVGSTLDPRALPLSAPAV